MNVAPAEENLHYAWDEAVVVVLEKKLGTTEREATARELEALYPATNELMIWKPGESEQIAWESHHLAETDVYHALGIPESPCELHSCDSATRTAITLSLSYMIARPGSQGVSLRGPDIEHDSLHLLVAFVFWIVPT